MFLRYPSIIGCTVAAFLAWIIIPSTALDRGFFHLMASCFFESPYFVSGKGHYSDPYTLRAEARNEQNQESKPLPQIAITEDAERIFQSSPPSPLDFAVILKNLRRMGQRSVAIGLPLAWSDADMISHSALEQQLGEFDRAITSAPLSRKPSSSALPLAFRRASLDLDQVQGDIKLLPLVNFVSMPNAVLGNASSWAGFFQLESEPESSRHHLMARWDDRVVMSFPLLALIHQFKAKPEEIKVHLGKWISLSNSGSFIPIDEFGRLALALPDTQNASIPAEKLIDAPDDFLASFRNGMALINNEIPSADEATLRCSKENAVAFALLSARSGAWRSKSFPRLPWFIEMLIIDSLLCLIFGLSLLIRHRFRLCVAVIAGIMLMVQFALFGMAEIWLPLPALLIACVTAFLLEGRATHPRKKSFKELIEKKNWDTQEL